MNKSFVKLATDIDAAIQDYRNAERRVVDAKRHLAYAKTELGCARTALDNAKNAMFKAHPELMPTNTDDERLKTL